LSETAQSTPRPRIESLSDMIFGLALSVGAITLVGNPPQTTPELYSDITSFGFSFLIVIMVWMRYTRIMSVLPLETGRTVLLNTVLLFCVSLEPFLFHIVLSSPIAGSGSVLYAIDLGGLNAIMGFFTLALADEEKKLITPDLIKQFRNDGIFTFVAGGIFFASALPVFWRIYLFGGPLRYDLWLFPLVILSVRRRLPHRKK
jgi:uncharacterized membrane protein